MFFDTHAHYDDERFDDDRHELLSAFPAEGVSLVLNPGCDMTFALPEGSWDLYVDDQHAGTQKLNDESLSGEITLEGLSAYIFLKTK